jgi:apolipoprotein N-acyltransferase
MKLSQLFRIPLDSDFFLAVLSGVLLIFSFPNPLSPLMPHFPFGLLVWIALVPFLVCLEGKTLLESFRLGWLTGVIGFTGILHWVIVSMHRYGGIPIAITIIILALLTLYLSLYIGGFATLLCLVRSRTGWTILVVAPPLWVALEYLRSVLLTGFPWENLGYSQYLALPLIQMADVTGVYGLSFLIVLVNGLIASILVQIRRTGRLRIGSIITVAVILGAVLIYGSVKIRQEKERISARSPISVGVAQGNVDQSLKWEEAHQKETIEIYKGLTQEVSRENPDLIVWPETAVPFFFPFDQPYSPIVRAIPTENGTPLLFGSPFYQEVEGGYQYLNSAYLLAPDGEIRGRYDKIHLVPFGEYVPLSRLLSFIAPIVETVGNIASGDDTMGPVVFSIPEGDFSVLICYEIIFPELTRRFIQKGADFLVTITNDAWFGRTSAPFQHFSMATFRAVENRTFIARAANTGISGFIDSTGRIVDQTDIFTRQTMTGKVFKRTTDTFYTRYGDVFAYACLAWSLLGIVGAVVFGREKRGT